MDDLSQIIVSSLSYDDFRHNLLSPLLKNFIFDQPVTASQSHVPHGVQAEAKQF
jgi:hypothetical protein